MQDGLCEGYAMIQQEPKESLIRVLHHKPDVCAGCWGRRRLVRLRHDHWMGGPLLKTDAQVCAGDARHYSVAALTTSDSIGGTPSLDASARGPRVRDASGRAAHKCILLGTDASAATGGRRAPVAEKVGLIGRLIKLHGKGLNPLANLYGSILRYNTRQCRRA